MVLRARLQAQHAATVSARSAAAGSSAVVVPKYRADRAAIASFQRLAGNSAASAHVAQLMLQRDVNKTGGGAASVEVIFVIRKPKDVYTEGMAAYARTTLKGQIVREVANIDDMAVEAAAIAKTGTKISKLSIVGHGQTSIGGVGMTPAGEKSWRFVSPDEVQKFVNGPAGKALRASMAKGANVEFWGCYLGSVQQAGQAWADLTGAPIHSTKGEMHVSSEKFIYATGRKTSARARASKDVPKGAKKYFDKWLLSNYKTMVATGEAPKLATNAEKVGYMTDLFDRSGGELLTRVITEKGGKAHHRPGSDGELHLWEETTPNP